MRTTISALLTILTSALVVAAQKNQAVDPNWTGPFVFDAGELVSTGRNPYFVLEAGHIQTLEGGGTRLVISVLADTRQVDGVETRVVEERETDKGELVEVSRNYFAISKRTNSVYYFGEDVDMYKGGKITSHEGTWLAGVKGAKPGLWMPGEPLLHAKYYQEIRARRRHGPRRNRQSVRDGDDAGRHVHERDQNRGDDASGAWDAGA